MPINIIKNTHTYLHTHNTYICTHTYTYIIRTYIPTHTHKLERSKMAEDEVARDMEEALNKIVNTTDQSRNMRKELKKTIYERVSTLSNL